MTTHEPPTLTEALAKLALDHLERGVGVNRIYSKHPEAPDVYVVSDPEYKRRFKTLLDDLEGTRKTERLGEPPQ